MRPTMTVTGIAMFRWSRYHPFARSNPEPVWQEPPRQRPPDPQAVPSRKLWSRMMQLRDERGSRQAMLHEPDCDETARQRSHSYTCR